MHSYTFCLDVYYFIFLIVKMPGRTCRGAYGASPFGCGDDI
jgi:hypothetical protein